MFDRVWVDCPKCGKRVEFQSKAGECLLEDYRLDNAPDAVLMDIVGDESACACGHRVKLRLETAPRLEVE